MSKMKFAGALVLALGLSTNAHAADVIGSCIGDIEQYCSNVEPGAGRMIACLYSHELVMSDGCDTAFAEYGNILDMMFERLRTVMATCSTDILSLCTDVEPGEGRIFACLRENEAELSASCSGTVGNILANFE